MITLKYLQMTFIQSNFTQSNFTQSNFTQSNFIQSNFTQMRIEKLLQWLTLYGKQPHSTIHCSYIFS